jgi:hypothetical protein
MCSDGQPAVDSPGSYRGRQQVRGRMGVLLCLLALALQYVTPVLHIWGETTPPTVQAWSAAAGPSHLDHAPHSALLRAASIPQKRIPHDAASCAVCQVCAHYRAWRGSRVWTVCRPAVASVSSLYPILRPANLLYAVIAARAPPPSPVFC